MRRLFIVYNPLSGRYRVHYAWKRLLDLLPSEDFFVESLNVQEADLCRADFRNYDCIIIIGGDGTLRSVVQKLQDEHLDIPIALVPRGSANLLAKSLGLPFSLLSAVQLIIAEKTAAIDVGRLSTGEYFIGAFALGYFSHRIVTTNQQLKKIAGFAGYFWSFIRETRLPKHTFKFSVDDRSYTVSGHSLFIVNTSNLFGFHSTRVADFRDGVFELAVTTNKTFLSIIGLLIDFYLRRGKPKHFFLASGSRFSLHDIGGSYPQIDGDALLERDSTDISVLPRAQRFIVP